MNANSIHVKRTTTILKPDQSRVGAIRSCVRIPSVPSEAEGLPCLLDLPRRAPLLGLGVEESPNCGGASR